MSRWRVYIQPFDTTGAYTGVYTEVTKDVLAVDSPKQAIDNTDFDVGVIKNSGFSVTLRNDQGIYSDVAEPHSMFNFTRKNSRIKITWDTRNYDLVCYFFNVGQEPLGGEYLVFEGLLNEVASISDIDKQQATFQVFGFDSVLDETNVPYSSINNGDLFSVVLYTMLNQAPFNTLVTVSQANIVPSLDLPIDDKTPLQDTTGTPFSPGTTVGSSISDILLAANSVLFIKNGIVYVTGRVATAAIQKTFYGQASDLGIEGILTIDNFRDGMNRVFNYWTWTGTALVSYDNTSLVHYGILAKDMSLDLITNPTNEQTILDTNKTEFAFPKIEFELTVPIWYDNLALNILDRIAVDYPTVHIPFNGGDLPRYGLGVLYDGTARYPYDQWALTLDTSTNFKIMSKKIDTKKDTITFGVREI